MPASVVKSSAWPTSWCQLLTALGCSISQPFPQNCLFSPLAHYSSVLPVASLIFSFIETILSLPDSNLVPMFYRKLRLLCSYFLQGLKTSKTSVHAAQNIFEICPPSVAQNTGDSAFKGT